MVNIILYQLYGRHWLILFVVDLILFVWNILTRVVGKIPYKKTGLTGLYYATKITGLLVVQSVDLTFCSLLHQRLARRCVKRRTLI